MIQNYIASNFRKLLIRNGYKPIRKNSSCNPKRYKIKYFKADEKDKTETSRNRKSKGVGMEGGFEDDSFPGAKVALFGSNGTTGRMTAFLLKQSPLISDLILLDTTDTKGHGLDLSHINTRCKIHTDSNFPEPPELLKDVDIVVLAAGRSLLASLNPRDMFEVNAGVIESHAMVCATTCPNALVAVTTWPSIYNVPLVSEVYKRLGVYNPDKIIGNCTLNVMCANTILGNEFYLDPESIHVPLAGGNSSTTMVPLLSKAQPFAEFSQETAEKLTEEILMCNRRFSRKHSRPLKATRAHAINRFVLTLVRGLMDQPDAIMTAFVRSNVLPHCKYCASQLLFGPQGVKLNFGIPKITPYELDLLSTSVAELTRVYEFVEKYSESEFDYRKRRSLDRCFTQPGKKQMFAVEQTC